MTANLRVIEGAGNQGDRAHELLVAIVDVLDEKGEGVSIATILGCLELAKSIILETAAGE